MATRRPSARGAEEGRWRPRGPLGTPSRRGCPRGLGSLIPLGPQPLCGSEGLRQERNFVKEKNYVGKGEKSFSWHISHLPRGVPFEEEQQR